MSGKGDPTPRLIGRETEHIRFAECLGRASQGTPTFLLFEGEAGSGKTSLLDEIAALPLLKPRRVRVLRIDLSEQEAIDPVGRAADLIGYSRIFARFGGRRRIGALLRKVMPDWMGAIPVVGDVLEALTVTAQSIFRRLKKKKEPTRVTADMEELYNFARRRLLVLQIDELHRIEEAAAERLLRFVSRAGPGTRLLVVGAARTPPPGAARPAFRILQIHLPDERVTHHRLEALSFAELHEWLNIRFSELPLPPAVINFLLAETGGQPGPVLRMLDRLFAEGALARTDEGWKYDTAFMAAELADTDELDTHLQALSPDVAEAVRAASLFGDEFDALTLAKVLQLDELELEDRLAVAVRFGLIAVAGEWEQANGEISTLYRFSSSSLRAALHQSLRGERRGELEARMSG